ncbi:MAG: 5-bromo-4-chloroindolyl phosphate hydrolysis family protein [Magnetospiraceae bacterium]
MGEGLRQLIAGVAASALFLGGFFGLSLVWWVPLLLAVGAYVGVLLVVPKAKAPHEIEVSDGITKAEVDRAVQHCERAAAELRDLATEPKISEKMADTFEHMAKIIHEIGENFQSDPRDMVHARSLTDHHLDAMLDVARTYVSLRKATLNETAQARLDKVRDVILGYVEHFDAIYNACLANDFQRLEVATTALDQILKMETPPTLRS